MRISLFPVGGYLVVAAIALALLALFVLVPPRADISGRRRKTLLGLRLAVVALLIFALLRPTIVYTTTRKQSSTLVLLVDRSRSMQVADAFGDKTRWQALQTVLADAAPQLADLRREVELKIYAFDADLQQIPLEGSRLKLPQDATGAQTAIGWALQEVLRREAGRRLAGVVLLTDGAQRAFAPRDLPPQVPARQLADLGFPLHTVALGNPRAAVSSRDVALANLQAPDTVFVKNELAVGAAAKVSGFVNDNIPIELFFESAPGQMSAVSRRDVRATEDGQQLPVELTYVPQVAGEYKVTVRAQSPPGDASPANNELSTFVTVRKGGINVLYLEGGHPVEAKFIRRALAAFPDLHVEYLWLDARQRETRPADLATRFQPGKYDVYLIGDLDSSIFDPKELATLAATVQKGAGLAMLGGLHSFGPGGYQKTALAEVLPVRMAELERQNFGQPIATDLHLAGPLAMRPTPQGEQSRMLLLADRSQNQAAWAKLPPLEGANRFRGLAPLANVLAESADQNRAPLLVAQTPGNGRVLAFAADSTWRWAMQGHEDLHKRFWRQLVLWLAKKDQQTEGNVWVQLNNRRWQPGARVEFRAGAMGKDGEAITDAVFTAEIVLPDAARRPVRLTRQGDELVGSFYETDAAGDYTVVVSASRGGENLGTAQARFLVYEQDLELENPVPDASLLQNLARMTGGEAMTAQDFASFLDRFQLTRPDPIVEIQAKKTPWDTWPFFLALVGLLAAEWYLRKRWGLV